MRYVSMILFSTIIFSCKSTAPIYDNSWPVERYLRVASQYSEKKMYKEALNTYDQVFMRFSDKVVKVNIAEYEQGFVYFKMGKYNIAMKSFETVLSRFEDSLTANYFTKKDEWLRILAKKMIDKCDRKINHKKYAKLEKEAKLKAKQEKYEQDRIAKRAAIEAEDEMRATKKKEKEEAKKAKKEADLAKKEAKKASNKEKEVADSKPSSSGEKE